MSYRDAFLSTSKEKEENRDTNLKIEFAITAIDIPQSNLVIAITRTEETQLCWMKIY